MIRRVMGAVYAVFLSAAGAIRRSGRHAITTPTEPVRRLWIVNHYAVTPDLPGGTRHLDLARHLKDMGWETTIFACSFNHNTHTGVRRHRFGILPVREDVDGVTFVWLPGTPYSGNNVFRYLNMVSWSLLFLVFGMGGKRPDVIIGSSAHLLAGMVAWIAAKVRRATFVLEVRDVWPDSLIQLGLSNNVIIAALRWMERFLYERASAIVAVTDGIKQRIVAKQRVPEDHIVVIPNGVDATEQISSAIRTSTRRDMGWEDRVVIIWAGSLQVFNGLDVPINAFREPLRDLDELSLEFFGNGSERARLKELASGDERIRFHDPVPRNEVERLLQSADIGLVVAKKFDAFEGARPRKMFDYMNAGLPIVCNIPGEAASVLSEAGAAICTEWESPRRLAEAIRTLAGSRDLRRELGERGRRALLEKHGTRPRAEQLAMVLERLVSC